MELVTNIIIEYLKHNKRLVVPKLGAFIVKRPEGKVIFSELMRGDDNTLRSLLMAYGMNEIEANGRIDRLVFEIRHAVGRGDSFTIEGFGIFQAGENNNILFKQHREPMTFGGNVRPPFEKFNEAKRQMRSMRRTEEDYNETPPPSRTSKQRRVKSEKRDEEININLTKPESYLRGLKYENKKSKGHDDDYHRRDRGMQLNRRIALIILGIIVIGVATWLAWHFMFDDDTAQSVQSADSGNSATTEEVITQDSISVDRPMDLSTAEDEHVEVDTIKVES